jgi:caffeoyl-CoA O-methyltransferase
MPGAGMQIGSDQGQFMGLLARAIGAKRYLEIGVFTGYSSLAMALALPSDGRVVACDVSEEYTAVAKRYWQKAGVEKKIDLRLGPAVATLDKMIADKVELFDIAFIDADKTNYDAYYERCLQLVRPGGLILCDNMLWSGRVVDEKEHDADTDALRALNAKAGKDERVDVALLSVGDGILIARRL